jgi:hypothetical protein
MIRSLDFEQSANSKTDRDRVSEREIDSFRNMAAQENLRQQPNVMNDFDSREKAQAFKLSREVYNARKIEKNSLAEIQGSQTRAKNLALKIHDFDREKQKQKQKQIEVLYDSNFQIRPNGRRRRSSSGSHNDHGLETEKIFDSSSTPPKVAAQTRPRPGLAQQSTALSGRPSSQVTITSRQERPFPLSMQERVLEIEGHLAALRSRRTAVHEFRMGKFRIACDEVSQTYHVFRFAEERERERLTARGRCRGDPRAPEAQRTERGLPHNRRGLQ